MVHYLSVQDAAAKLADLVRTLAAGDEIALTDGARLIARVHPANETLPPRQPGLCAGMLDILDEGDDLIQEHFKDYMP